MNAVLVDSNVLLDVFSEDERWGAWSANALAAASDARRLVINAMIYAEVSVRFTRVEDLEAQLPRADFAREPLPFAAAFLAAKAHRGYRAGGGTRAATLPDLLLGAHAAVAGYDVLTRDPRRFRAYFPTVSLITP